MLNIRMVKNKTIIPGGPFFADAKAQSQREKEA